eukprot:838911-Alexandrium_andersonii.AAC.1
MPCRHGCWPSPERHPAGRSPTCGSSRHAATAFAIGSSCKAALGPGTMSSATAPSPTRSRATSSRASPLSSRTRSSTQAAST